jgi:hypothetical protein
VALDNLRHRHPEMSAGIDAVEATTVQCWAPIFLDANSGSGQFFTPNNTRIPRARWTEGLRFLE